jgi:arginine-tRNA-protein transferase
MKIFRSESLVDYKTYSFNYTIYCRQDNTDETDEIYRLGFLPYSNDLQLTEPHYYLARSLRVNLDEFKPTSENRRVIKKISEINPVIKCIEKNNFNRSQSFDKFCLDYTSVRFGGAMPPERFDYIYNWQLLNYIFEFSGQNKQLLGYVFAVITGEILHYWFSFYDLQYSRLGLGKWMMYSVIDWAKQNGFKEVYLGTCYGEKAMYKMRDFKSLSFFDGNQWNTDMKLLKNKCKTD